MATSVLRCNQKTPNHILALTNGAPRPQSIFQRPSFDDVVSCVSEFAMDERELLDHKTDRFNRLKGNWRGSVKQCHMRRRPVRCLPPVPARSRAEHRLKLQQTISLGEQDQRP